MHRFHAVGWTKKVTWPWTDSVTCLIVRIKMIIIRLIPATGQWIHFSRGDFKRNFKVRTAKATSKNRSSFCFALSFEIQFYRNNSRLSRLPTQLPQLSRGIRQDNPRFVQRNFLKNRFNSLWNVARLQDLGLRLKSTSTSHLFGYSQQANTSVPIAIFMKHER